MKILTPLTLEGIERGVCLEAVSLENIPWIPGDLLDT